MNKQTKDQIAREAEDFTIEKTKISVNSSFSVGEEQGLEAGYIAGAETWAERGEVLKEALEKIEGKINALVTEDTKGRAIEVAIIMAKNMQEISGITTDALSNYNNHK